MALTVLVNRCYRHKGVLPPKNRFVIGEAKDHFVMEIGPICNEEKWLPQIETRFLMSSILKWADGILCPERMTFDNWIDGTMIRDILRDAFWPRYPEQRLEQFYQAHVYLGNRNLDFTIGSLITACQTVH